MLVLLSLAPAEAAARRRVDLTPMVNAARAQQVLHESRMVKADRALKSLKRKLRKSNRRVRQVRRRFDHVKEQRADVRAALAGTEHRLAIAEALLPEATPEAALVLTTPLPLERAGQADPAGQAHPSGDPPADLGFIGPEGVVGAELAATQKRVDALKAERTLDRRRLRKAERKVRKVGRIVRSRERDVAKVKQQRRAALGRRSSSEAALKGAILSASRLAARKALRKTDVRPGRNTRFVWPTRGRISQGYGCTGSTFSPARGSCAHFHDGIDIVAGRGSVIRAAGVGVISYIGRNPWDRGKRAFMVVIAHPGGFESLYAHALPIRRVEYGQLVRKGQRIAYMGSTGHSTGVHLHLELRRGRTTLNPLALLR